MHSIITENEVLDPVHKKDIPDDADIVDSQFFLDRERHQDGSLNKYKARLVARGDKTGPGSHDERQCRNLSPCVLCSRSRYFSV